MRRFILPLLAAAPCFSCSQLFVNARNSGEREPAATGTLVGTGGLALSLARSTALSAIHHPVTTAKLGAVVLWSRPAEVVSANIPVETAASPRSAAAPGTPGFERLLDQAGMPPATRGKLTWLVDGPGFFGELDRQIPRAEKSIDVQVFIFDNDDIAVRYADRLKARSAQIPVRVLFDDLGNTFAKLSPPETPAPAGFTPPADMARYLEDGSAVRVRRTPNPWLVCDHTKLLVFDRRTAILGGMNIGREYFSEWHDLMVKVEGPAVEPLAREFELAWRHSRLLGDLLPRKNQTATVAPRARDGGIPLRILRTDPAEGRQEILNASLMAIHAARERVWVENPYLANQDIKLALEAAARRGVDVRVVLPGRNDSTIMDSSNLASARRLIEAGAKVFRYPGMTHLKAMVCDDWSTMGSANLDTLSLKINRELNLAFRDGDAIRALDRQVFLPDFRRSKRMRLSDTDSPIAPVAEMISDQL